MPCIVHWNQRHFVVVYEIRKKAWGWGQGAWGKVKDKRQKEKDKSQSDTDLHDNNYIVHVADPASGLLKYTEAEFLKCWYSTKSDGVQEGTALLLEPTPAFYSQEGEEKGKLKFMYLLNYINIFITFDIRTIFIFDVLNLFLIYFRK